MQPYDPFLVWHLNLGPARGTCDPPMLSKMMAISIPTSLGRTGPLGPRGPRRAGYTQRLRSWAVEVVYTVCFWY